MDPKQMSCPPVSEKPTPPSSSGINTNPGLSQHQGYEGSNLTTVPSWSPPDPNSNPKTAKPHPAEASQLEPNPQIEKFDNEDINMWVLALVIHICGPLKKVDADQRQQVQDFAAYLCNYLNSFRLPKAGFRTLVERINALPTDTEQAIKEKITVFKKDLDPYHLGIDQVDQKPIPIPLALNEIHTNPFQRLGIENLKYRKGLPKSGEPEGTFGSVSIEGSEAIKTYKRESLKIAVLLRLYFGIQAQQRASQAGLAPAIKGIAIDGSSLQVTYEKAEGKTIKSFFKDKKTSAKEKCRAILALLKALQELHKLGIVHRDLNHSNCMISQHEDGNYKITFIDFDFSIVPDISGQPKTPRIGTPEVCGARFHFNEATDQKNELHALVYYALQCILVDIKSEEREKTSIPFYDWFLNTQKLKTFKRFQIYESLSRFVSN